jgi:putative hydrolase of the HAD superfamily
MIEAVLFDLDNTLYSEFSFVESGMRSVAEYIERRFGLNSSKIKEYLLETLKSQGRGAVFDTLLQELKLPPEVKVPLLVYLYRTHRPQITLFKDVRRLFEELCARHIKMGMITDGLSSVQLRKIDALKIGNDFDVIICTDDLGDNYAKPSPVPFSLALHLLDVAAKSVVYVGDDETKDFAGPKELGIATIQIVHPMERPLRTGPLLHPQPADHSVTSFLEVIPILNL